jgi:hypothetical protein
MMKTIITALLVATLAAPVLTLPAAAAPYERTDAGQIDQSYNGTYQGAPLREWYRPDNW